MTHAIDMGFMPNALHGLLEGTLRGYMDLVSWSTNTLHTNDVHGIFSTSQTDLEEGMRMHGLSLR